ncbi:MAG: type II secretion system major pseudopilin GspG [Candidatus Omnitrophica bacterium]|nr:type II secretion system major pseudopilin GspG [Candidatus Omnitrophota bacterium]
MLRRRHPFCLKPGFLTGFTLVELLFVIVIIGTLAAIVVPRIVKQGARAKNAAARAFVDVQLATALRTYEMDNGKFPTTEEGLEALLSEPKSARNWRGPYLERKPIDPWGREYGYQSPGTYNTRSYDLYSLGQDGEKSQDDITNW